LQIAAGPLPFSPDFVNLFSMKPLSLSGLNLTAFIRSVRWSFLPLALFVTSFVFGQRSYFEYNNPDAVKIDQKVIDQLTAVEWAIQDVRWLIRKDTFDFGGGGLMLHDDGSYSSRHPITTGMWEVKYHHYLVLKDTSERINNRGLSGTFAITSVTDSLLVLNQLYTSSRDMSRTLTLVKYDPRRTRVARADQGGRTPDEMRKLYTEMRRTDERFFTKLVDSLKYLSKEELAFLGYREVNDTLFFNSADSLYKVHLDRNNPLKKVRIFHENEDIPDHEAYRRFTMPADLLPLVDSLAMNYIRQHRDDYAPQKEITSMGSYFRQYVGYYDINGDAIVLINAFCQYKGDWRESFVQVGLGGVCYFNISVNLTKKVAFSFNVNDF
jgi:hypothetical protein